MQDCSEPDRLSRERASIAIIKQAIHDRACLTGTHVEFRVPFAPHVLGRGVPFCSLWIILSSLCVRIFLKARACKRICAIEHRGGVGCW
jgi:hypothetical protein